MLFVTKLHSHKCKGEKTAANPALEPLPGRAALEAESKPIFSVQVLPPYRGGILLRGQSNLQGLERSFFTFFLQCIDRWCFALASKIRAEHHG